MSSRPRSTNQSSQLPARTGFRASVNVSNPKIDAPKRGHSLSDFRFIDTRSSGSVLQQKSVKQEDLTDFTPGDIVGIKTTKKLFFGKYAESNKFQIVLGVGSIAKNKDGKWGSSFTGQRKPPFLNDGSPNIISIKNFTKNAVIGEAWKWGEPPSAFSTGEATKARDTAAKKAISVAGEQERQKGGSGDSQEVQQSGWVQAVKNAALSAKDMLTGGGGGGEEEKQSEPLPMCPAPVQKKEGESAEEGESDEE